MVLCGGRIGVKSGVGKRLYFLVLRFTNPAVKGRQKQMPKDIQPSFFDRKKQIDHILLLQLLMQAIISFLNPSCEIVTII